MSSLCGNSSSRPALRPTDNTSHIDRTRNSGSANIQTDFAELLLDGRDESRAFINGKPAINDSRQQRKGRVKPLHERIAEAISTFTHLSRSGLDARALAKRVYDTARGRLTQEGKIQGAAQSVAKFNAEFEAVANERNFTTDWTDLNTGEWIIAFPKVFSRDDPISILEIGSWEGRSALFFLTYFRNSRLTAIDTWEGSDEHKVQDGFEVESTESRFDRNLSAFDPRLTKLKGSSQQVLPTLLPGKEQFDIVYVDGSHLADDVLIDGIYGWRLLKPGGIIIFDDLAWKFYPRRQDNPAWAIGAFLKYYKGNVKMLNMRYQGIIQKIGK